MGTGQFGASARDRWLLEPGCAYLNHGSFGATPRTVLAAQTAWRDRMEAQPARFMAESGERLRHAAATLGAYVGARGEDIAFVENATAGINAVVRSLSLQPGDRLVTTNHAYGAVRKTLEFACDRTGAVLAVADIPFPIADPAEIVAAIAATLDRLPAPARLLVVDGVTSPTALILPLADIVALSRSRGVPVLIDGAHVPGMVPIDLAALGADWFAGNCHKWLCAPKGCGFLWAAPARQADLHPTVISHGYGTGFLAEFDWTGTRDLSAWLAVTAAIAFWQEIGEAEARRYCHTLLHDAIALLCDAWGVAPPASAALLGQMATLPCPVQDEEARALHNRLWADHRLEVPIVPFQANLWVRISAQIYNDLGEYERLAAALR